ncbi:hypothetical protein F442_21819 [Phytophthora nicotianae P10297]|uniref:Uncharacterized protein n=1 Tax=Phytophthora nicotianae P10297 TaxID=1317064 RepID=W2Y1V2_PHYNI|nr:hypothetical protein F442_21819 [Phytophthora nicotianae P10297]
MVQIIGIQFKLISANSKQSLGALVIKLIRLGNSSTNPSPRLSLRLKLRPRLNRQRMRQPKYLIRNQRRSRHSY